MLPASLKSKHVNAFTSLAILGNKKDSDLKKMAKISNQKVRIRRHKRVRAKVWGNEKRPRLCIFRSNQHIYASLIDDEKNRTLLTVSDLESRKVKTEKEIGKGGKISLACKVGELIAQKALKNKIETVVFDRGGYKYHGRVKSLADGARKGGLKF